MSLSAEAAEAGQQAGAAVVLFDVWFNICMHVYAFVHTCVCVCVACSAAIVTVTLVFE